MATALQISSMYHEGAEYPEKAVDLLRTSLTIGDDGSVIAFRALKKKGQLDKKAQLAEAIGKFIAEVSDDFIALARKSTEIEKAITAMSIWELMEKGLDKQFPEEKLLMEDAEAMTILKRRKSLGALNKLKRECEKILELTAQGAN